MATVTKLIAIKNPTKIKRQQWQRLQKTYSEACNWVLSRLQSRNTKLSSKDVPFTLKSALKNEAIRQAKKAFSDFKEGRAEKLPKFKPHMPVFINNQNWDFRQKDGHWHIGFTTNQGKIYLPIVERSEDSWVFPLGQRIGKINPLGTAKLFRKGRKWFVSIPIEISCELDIDYPAQTEIGVDLGLVNLAVVCEPKSNKRIFFSGKQVGFKRRKFRSLRQSLQKKKALRVVKAVGHKEQRWMKDINHKVSKAVVKFAKQFPNPIIKIEKLSNIRKSKSVKKADRNINNWAFYQLQEFIKYKAQLAGIPVVEVTPKYTSQRCFNCGVVIKSNRKGQQYKCSCGYTSHADLNASKNIAIAEPLTQAKWSRKLTA